MGDAALCSRGRGGDLSTPVTAIHTGRQRQVPKEMYEVHEKVRVREEKVFSDILPVNSPQNKMNKYTQREKIRVGKEEKTPIWIERPEVRESSSSRKP